MQRPTGGIKKWASDPRATVEKPSDAFIRKGFTNAKPSVGIFNWLFKRLFEWVEYLDQPQEGDNHIHHEHSTSRPRLEIPLILPETNKLGAIEVLKKTEVLVAEVSEQNYSGSGSVTPAVAESRDFTYVASTAKSNFFNSVYLQALRNSRSFLSSAQRELSGLTSSYYIKFFALWPPSATSRAFKNPTFAYGSDVFSSRFSNGTYTLTNRYSRSNRPGYSSFRSPSGRSSILGAAYQGQLIAGNYIRINTAVQRHTFQISGYRS